MNAREVTLPELLASREARANRQKELLSSHPGAALISFTVNYPGPVKTGEDARFLHQEGARAIGRQFLYTPVPHYELVEHVTGPEGFWLVEAPALEVKRRCCELEETHALGRLFDIDVLGPDGVPIPREQTGFARRKCLLCEGDPTVCRREGRHELGALTARIHEMISGYQSAHQH